MMNGTRRSMPWDTLAGSATRSPRVLETRERTQQSEAYRPPSMLPDPEPRDGWSFRWVRTETRNQADKTHFNKRSREGYVPVRAEEHPELMAELFAAEGQKSGVVEVGGLILCKIPIEKVHARVRYYADRNSAEMSAADSQYMRDNDQRMAKVVERKSTFGRSPVG